MSDDKGGMIDDKKAAKNHYEQIENLLLQNHMCNDENYNGSNRKPGKDHRTASKNVPVEEHQCPFCNLHISKEIGLNR